MLIACVRKEEFFLEFAAFNFAAEGGSLFAFRFLELFADDAIKTGHRSVLDGNAEYFVGVVPRALFFGVANDFILSSGTATAQFNDAGSSQ